MSKVSVVVPIYRAESFLERCIESLVGQTIADIEIILVDDGSPDGSGAICDKWAERNDLGSVKIVVVHRKKNGGHSAARNSGLEQASGEYVGFVDSDDSIGPEMYERLYSVAKDLNADVAQCGVRLSPLNQPDVIIRPKAADLECESLGQFPQLIHNQTKFVVDKIYRREMLQRFGIRFRENVRYHEDHFFLADVDLAFKRYVVSDYIGYTYYIRRDGASTTSFDERLLDCSKAYEGIRSEMISHGLWPSVREEVLKNAFESYRLRVGDFSKYRNVRLQNRIVNGWFNFFVTSSEVWRKQFLAGIGSRGERFRYSLLTIKPIALGWIILPLGVRRIVDRLFLLLQKCLTAKR